MKTLNMFYLVIYRTIYRVSHIKTLNCTTYEGDSHGNLKYVLSRNLSHYI